MRALVTGATGFLGSHLVDACLAQGDVVSALARASSDLGYLKTLPDVDVRFGDLSDAASVDRATRDVDVIHHSAARVLDYGTRRQFFDANVVGTANLLKSARKNGVSRFVFVSSPSVVADGQHQVGIDESYPYPARYLNLYSETKAEAERLVLAANEPGFVTCSIRPRGVWGPRDRLGFMPKLVSRLVDRRMRDLSGGQKIVASICHAENAARACLLAAASANVAGKAYFVTDREVNDVWAFMNTLAATFDAPPIAKRVSPAVLRVAVAIFEALWKIPALAHHRSPPLSRYGVSLLTKSATYDLSAAERDFGYAPIVTQEQGLSRLRAWVDALGGVEEWVRHAR